MLKYWARFQRHGILPVGGGWLDQTQSWIEAVDEIDAAFASMQE